eukprot:1158508-Pelagomonas_calceolata.AAC.7
MGLCQPWDSIIHGTLSAMGLHQPWDSICHDVIIQDFIIHGTPSATTYHCCPHLNTKGPIRYVGTEHSNHAMGKISVVPDWGELATKTCAAIATKPKLCTAVATERATGLKLHIVVATKLKLGGVIATKPKLCTVVATERAQAPHSRGH